MSQEADGNNYSLDNGSNLDLSSFYESDEEYNTCVRVVNNDTMQAQTNAVSDSGKELQGDGRWDTAD